MQQRGVRLERIGEWMAAAPARLAGLAGSKGALARRRRCGLRRLRPRRQNGPCTRADLHFRHKISPYLGAELRGRVVETWLRGEPVFRDEGTIHAVEGARQRAGARDDDDTCARRAIAECRRIAAMSEEPDRITRRFLTPPVREVHALLRGRMEAMGMTVRADAAGNLRGLWQPPDAARQAAGSRLAH